MLESYYIFLRGGRDHREDLIQPFHFRDLKMEAQRGKTICHRLKGLWKEYNWYYVTKNIETF